MHTLYLLSILWKVMLVIIIIMFSIKFGARLLCLFLLAECLAYWEHNYLRITITYLADPQI